MALAVCLQCRHEPCKHCNAPAAAQTNTTAALLHGLFYILLLQALKSLLLLRMHASLCLE